MVKFWQLIWLCVNLFGCSAWLKLNNNTFEFKEVQDIMMISNTEVRNRQPGQERSVRMEKGNYELRDKYIFGRQII